MTKNEPFWSGRVALHGKEAGNLQQSSEYYPGSDRSRAPNLTEEQQNNIQDKK